MDCEGLWSVGKFQNLVLKLVCLGSWFLNLIFLKSFRFSIFLILLEGSRKSCTMIEIWREEILKWQDAQNSPSSLNGKFFLNGRALADSPRVLATAMEDDQGLLHASAPSMSLHPCVQQEHHLR